MRILFITQYFPPETGAPQNRLMGLAQQLKAVAVDTEVLTAMPNYPSMKVYESFKGKFFVKDGLNSIPVYRGWIFVSTKRSVLFRLLNYFSFVFSSFIISFRIKGKFDYVLCESPPLFLGISAWLISKLKGAKFIFNVSDLWPESAERLGIITNKVLLKSATVLEHFLYRKSFLITGQTQGIVKNISDRFPLKRTHWLPNGIDKEQYEVKDLKNVRDEYGLKADDFILLYAGILGHAQGLEIIINVAERLLGESRIKFLFAGDGPEKNKLMQMKEEKKLMNVFFIGSVKKEQIKNIVFSVDAAIIPLRKLDLFLGAIPSKIFENLMLEKPVLLGVDGEARELFIDKGKTGIYFTPEDIGELHAGILQLYHNRVLCAELGRNGKRYVLENFDRKKITELFLEQLK